MDYDNYSSSICFCTKFQIQAAASLFLYVVIYIALDGFLYSEVTTSGKAAGYNNEMLDNNGQVLVASLCALKPSVCSPISAPASDIGHSRAALTPSSVHDAYTI